MRRLLLPGLLVAPVVIALAPLAGVLWAGDSGAGGEVLITVTFPDALTGQDADVMADAVQPAELASAGPHGDCSFSSISASEG